MPIMGLPRLIRMTKKKQPDHWVTKLNDWFQTPLGQAVFQEEADIANQILPMRFGYHLLYCGVEAPDKIVEDSPIAHKFSASGQPYCESWLPFVYGESDMLPLANQSVDCVVLQHSLDFEREPHQVLREAARVLIPGGTLMVIGFNPWSTWSLSRLLNYRSAEAPWPSRFISPARLSDWLQILDLDVEGVETGFYLPPWQSLIKLGFLRRFKQIAKQFFRGQGAVYVLLAKKNVSCMTPVTPKWRATRRKVFNSPLATKTIHK
ncbi:MAG: class I SAM-dependent methyltransferase [Gammaproteobacteria bacterium]|nr:class I SAM-dependent methyltransferase [Gammaproteobacteria bacterium]